MASQIFILLLITLISFPIISYGYYANEDNLDAQTLSLTKDESLVERESEHHIIGHDKEDGHIPFEIKKRNNRRPPRPVKRRPPTSPRPNRRRPPPPPRTEPPPSDDYNECQ
ncbi:hypothetical protein ABFX02_14G025600 [Erythranthe guttata]